MVFPRALWKTTHSTKEYILVFISNGSVNTTTGDAECTNGGVYVWLAIKASTQTKHRGGALYSGAPTRSLSPWLGQDELGIVVVLQHWIIARPSTGTSRCAVPFEKIPRTHYLGRPACDLSVRILQGIKVGLKEYVRTTHLNQVRFVIYSVARGVLTRD